MGAREPRVGAEYATASGLPVRVVGINAGQVELESLASTSRFYVPAGYPLGLMTNLAVARRSDPHQACDPAAGAPMRMNKPLAPIIDVMLLGGGHTIRGIVVNAVRRMSKNRRSLRAVSAGR